MAFTSPLIDSPAVASGSAEAGQQNVGKRTVHRLAHDLGKDDAAGSDQAAGHDQDGILNDEPGGAGGEAGVTIEQGDHHRHIRAADGDDREHAEHQRKQDDQKKDGITARGMRAEDRAAEQRQEKQSGVERLLEREKDRAGLNFLRQLGVGEDAPGKGDSADQDGEKDRQRR